MTQATVTLSPTGNPCPPWCPGTSDNHDTIFGTQQPLDLCVAHTRDLGIIHLRPISGFQTQWLGVALELVEMVDADEPVDLNAVSLIRLITSDTPRRVDEYELTPAQARAVAAKLLAAADLIDPARPAFVGGGPL